MKKNIIIVVAIIAVVLLVTYFVPFGGWGKWFSSPPKTKGGPKMCVTLPISKEDSSQIAYYGYLQGINEWKEEESQRIQQNTEVGWDKLNYSNITTDTFELYPTYIQNPSNECGLYDVWMAKDDLAGILGTSTQKLEGIREKIKENPVIFLTVLENTTGVIRGIMKLTGTTEIFQKSFTSFRAFYEKKDKKKVAACNKIFSKYGKEKTFLIFIDPKDDKKLAKRKKSFEDDIEKMVKSDATFFVKDSWEIPEQYKYYLFEKRVEMFIGKKNMKRLITILADILY